MVASGKGVRALAVGRSFARLRWSRGVGGCATTRANEDDAHIGAKHEEADR